MNTIEWPLFLIRRSGEVLEINTSEELLGFVSCYGAWSLKHRMEIITGYSMHNGWPVIDRMIVHNEWIARDSFGKVVGREIIDQLRKNTYYARYNKRMAEVRAIAEKGLPIPRTGKIKWNKHNAPAKKNSGFKHHARNIERSKQDMKEHDLNCDSRLKHKVLY